MSMFSRKLTTNISNSIRNIKLINTRIDNHEREREREREKEREREEVGF